MDEKLSRYGQENYKDTSNLGGRKSFNQEYVKPNMNFKEEIIKVLDLPNDKKILDVACGYGDFLIFLKSLGHKGELFGVDLSENFIQEANQKSRDINFSIANAESLPFEDESFDIVICKHSLYHFEDLQKAIKEMQRVLRKDGFLLITLNTLANGSRAKIEKYKDLLSEILQLRHLDNNRRINMESYHKHFENFKIIKETRIFGYVDLKESKPLVDYMDTLKEFFNPIPSDSNWGIALDLIKKDIEKEISENGSFKETWGAGIVLMKR